MASKKLKSDCREETEEGQNAEKGNWDELPQEVLNMIFNDLPVADLLSCSVMCKNWKKASRDVLKRTRECYAHIKDFPRDVQDLNDVMSSQGLMQMFNGLHIKIRRGEYGGRCDWQEEFSCSYAENLLKSKQTRQKLERAKRKLKAVLCGQWKYLNLDMGDYWGQILSIDDALLLRDLISTTSESLQKLVVAWDLDCHFLSCCGNKFTRLQVLQTQDTDTTVGQYGDGEETYMEEFVLKLAPNLEEITGEMLSVQVHHPGNPFIMKRMKSIFVAPDLVISEAGLMEGFRYVSGLYRLNLRIHRCRNSNDVSILLLMMLRSSKTLEELFIRTSELYNLVKTSDDIKLPNLRRLSLSLYAMPVEDEISVLRRLNLPKMCPNLEHLEFTLDEFRENYEEEDGYPLDGLHELDRSDLPLKIKFKCTKGRGWGGHLGGGIYNHKYLEFLSQIYPKIHEVKVLKWEWEPGYNSDIPNNIFSDLHALEYLEIDVSRDQFYSFDVAGIAAILCGINVEEANFLFIEPPTTNTELHRCIVPTGPTIFNAKNLKELKFVCGGTRSEDCDSPSWVIRVTENLPVRHERELIVIFEGAEEVYCKLNDLAALKTLLCAQVKEN